jgi:hypothetical protein
VAFIVLALFKFIGTGWVRGCVTTISVPGGIMAAKLGGIITSNHQDREHHYLCLEPGSTRLCSLW